MNQHEDDFNLDEIFEELEDVLKGNTTKKESSHDDEDGKDFSSMFRNNRTSKGNERARVTADNEQLFNREVLPLLERIHETAKENGMDFFFAMKTVEREGSYDITSTGYLSDPDEAETSGKKKTPVCEFLAMFEIVRMPHDFSHAVINAAMNAISQMDLMNSFMEFLKKHHSDNDSDD